MIHVKKNKITLSLLLMCFFLLISVFPYNITATAQNDVKLIGSFSGFEEMSMQSTDGVNFSTTVELSEGAYQFLISDNGCQYGHTGTIKDTTVMVSNDGWVLSSSINAKCTFIAEGGSYTFKYNTESRKLQVLKEGFLPPIESEESLKLHIGSQELEVNKGDKISYDVYLQTDELFEDVQAVISYNEDKLQLAKIKSTSDLTDREAEALYNCPNLTEVIYNSDYPGVVAANASCVSGYDFTEEKLFLTLDFTVVGTGESSIEFTVQEMTVKGGEKSYFLYSTKSADGAKFRVVVDVIEYVPPTEPTKATSATDITTVEPAESSTAAEETAPKPTETSAVTEVTTVEPTETSISATAKATEPTETTTFATEITEPTKTTEPKSEYQIGDVNRDGKLNIRDATLIQKYLAKMTDFDSEQTLLADFKADNKVNIKDATLIQKRIANLA